MSKTCCIIIEDEPLARKILEDYISRIPFLKLQGSFEDAIDAAEYLRNSRIDLIFLDIHLPQIKGVSFLRTLPNPPPVIITSAYHEYALEGYELNVIDYLLKPFEFERFLTAVNKIKNLNPGKDVAGISKNYLWVNVQLKKVKILFSEIVYVESQKEYIRIVTDNSSFITRMGTHEIESLLPPTDFKRIHRSFIVAIHKIRSFNSERVDINGKSIPVGRNYKDVLENL